LAVYAKIKTEVNEFLEWEKIQSIPWIKISSNKVLGSYRVLFLGFKIDQKN
jgi:hypothetical protein